MKKGLTFNRRRFLGLGLLALAGASVHAAWRAVNSFLLHQNKSKSWQLSLTGLSEITFHDEIIVISKGEELRAYSAVCTHLGCLINRAEQNELVCPCHGSRFDSRGRVVKGPAQKDLPKLNYTLDKEKNMILIRQDKKG